MSNFDSGDSSLLRIRNYNIHPENKKYWVFFFSDIDMAKYFEGLLTESNIEFEKDESEDLVKRVLYGIHKRDMEQALELNNIAIGKFRKPFIVDPTLRYVIIFISVAVVILSIVGYFKTKT